MAGPILYLVLVGLGVLVFYALYCRDKGGE